MARCHTPLGYYYGHDERGADSYYAKPNPRAATLGRGLSVDQAEYAVVRGRKPPPPAPSPVKQSSCDYATVGAGGTRGGLTTSSTTSMVRPDYGGSTDRLDSLMSSSTAMMTYDFPSSMRSSGGGDSETIERYIAVPISSTDHLLISSTGTGQHYLAEPVSALLTGSIRERLLDRMQQQQQQQGPPPLPDRCGSGRSMSAMRAYSPAPSLYSPTYDRPPPPLPAPGYERPPPLGANSRAASKLSLDVCSDKETEF